MKRGSLQMRGWLERYQKGGNPGGGKRGSSRKKSPAIILKKRKAIQNLGEGPSFFLHFRENGCKLKKKEIGEKRETPSISREGYSQRKKSFIRKKSCCAIFSILGERNRRS